MYRLVNVATRKSFTKAGMRCMLPDPDTTPLRVDSASADGSAAFSIIFFKSTPSSSNTFAQLNAIFFKMGIDTFSEKSYKRSDWSSDSTLRKNASVLRCVKIRNASSGDGVLAEGSFGAATWPNSLRKTVHDSQCLLSSKISTSAISYLFIG